MVAPVAGGGPLTPSVFVSKSVIDAGLDPCVLTPRLLH